METRRGVDILAEGKKRAANEARQTAAARFTSARSADAIKATAIRWLWQAYVPLGALTLLYGQEGDGKSTLTMMLAAMVTLGTLPGALNGSPSPVDIFAYEDDPASVLKPRLMAAGADMSMVRIHGDDSGSELLTIPDEVPALGDYLRERGPGLVIVDPLPDALRDGLKDNNNGDVRSGLVPLQRTAAEVGTAVLGVTHPNKGATDAANKVMGSKAWRSVPRSVLLYGRDPDDLTGPTRIVAVSKANYTAKTAAKVKIESTRVEGVGHPQPRATIQGTSSYTDADVLVASVGGTLPADKPQSQHKAAEKLLYRLLEAGGGEIAAEVAYNAGEVDGISRATMRRAKASIGAEGRGQWTFNGLNL